MKIAQLLLSMTAVICYSITSAQQITVQVSAESTEDQIPFPVLKIDGTYQFLGDESGIIQLDGVKLPAMAEVSALGYHTLEIQISEGTSVIQMSPDPILFDEVVVSDYHVKKDRFDSPTSISIIRSPERQGLGTGALLSEVPGMFVDYSLGEVYSRVYSRGISTSAEDDIGWFYQSLQENGLPLSSIQYNYFTPDFFSRPDLTTQKVEVIRGGKAGVLAQNAPGGSINFISKNPLNSQGEVRGTFGLRGESNAYFRGDVYVPFSIDGRKWTADIGGFYRYDQGHRNTDYPWNLGGQLRGNLQMTNDNSVFSLRLKVLDDRVNRHTGMSAENWNDPQAAFGQDFNFTALMLPEFSSQVGATNPNNVSQGYSYDPSNGIHVQEASAQFDADINVKRFRIKNQFKVSDKNIDWQTSFANQPLGLESFLPYFLSGADFPFGLVEFRDINTNEIVAQVNNAGALNAFQGDPPTFEYVQGSLPNDALMGIAPWKKEDQLTEIMNQLSVSYDANKHQISSGFFYSFSDLEYYTSAGFAYATFEPQPRMLRTTLTDFEGNQLTLSDENGMANNGGLFFESGRFDANQFAFFLNDEFRINDAFTLDAGLRYENVGHKGTLDIPGGTGLEGGTDGNPATAFDNTFMVPSGAAQSIDFNYDYLSYTGALSYRINKNNFSFIRFSETNKAPEINFYIQNFSGLPLEEAGEVQTISQFELGYRYSNSKLGISIIAFHSVLDNIGISDFTFDQETNEIYYAPVQINKTSTTGLELQWTWQMNSMFSLQGAQTIQTSEAQRFTVYRSNGSASTDDDEIVDFSGNTLPHTPNIMSRIGLTGAYSDFNWTVDWNFMGKRFGNAENSFELPSFSTFGLDMNYRLSDQMNLSLNVENLLNSDGLMNFFGPNEFGSSANNATEAFIANNPDASFVVFPILPRSVQVSVGFRW